MKRRPLSPIDPWTGQRRAGPATGLYCRTCRYDLRSSVAAGRCPECGTDFHPRDPTSYLERLPEPTHWSTYAMWAAVVGIVALAAATAIQVMAAASSGGH